MPDRVEIKQKKSPDMTAQIMSLVEHMDHAQLDEMLYGIRQVDSGNEAKLLLEALKNMRLADAVEYLRNSPPSAEIIMFMIVLATISAENERQKIEFDMRTEIARNAADGRHNQRGGYRQKKEDLQKTWAIGKYINRNVCAEAEHTSLGVVFDKAREYLSGTPDPDPWPEKLKKKK